MNDLPSFLLAIFAIFLFSAFVKCVTTFGILRYGLGFHGSGINIAFFVASLALSIMILAPQIESSGGISGLFNHPPKTFEELNTKFSPILTKYTDPTLLDKFNESAKRLKAGDSTEQVNLHSDTKFSVLGAAYIITELRDAFKIGFLILIPFLVIDLIVLNILLLLGANNISSSLVALPLKVLLFFAIDGWALLSEKLINGYM